MPSSKFCQKSGDLSREVWGAGGDPFRFQLEPRQMSRQLRGLGMGTYLQREFACPEER